MTTLQEKIDAQWKGVNRAEFPQFTAFEGIHPMEEVEALSLGDLCDYTERLASHCKSLQAVWEDDGVDTRETLADHNSHLGLVAKLLAQRCRQEG